MFGAFGTQPKRGPLPGPMPEPDGFVIKAYLGVSTVPIGTDVRA